MILYLILVGFVGGFVGAAFAYKLELSWFEIIMAYSFAGALSLVLAAILFSLAPPLPRVKRKTRKKVPDGVRSSRR